MKDILGNAAASIVTLALTSTQKQKVLAIFIVVAAYFMIAITMDDTAEMLSRAEAYQTQNNASSLPFAPHFLSVEPEFRELMENTGLLGRLEAIEAQGSITKDHIKNLLKESIAKLK